MSDTDSVRILDGSSFVVSDSRGDIETSTTTPNGFFALDVRHLSQWILTVDEERLSPLSVDDIQYFEARFFLIPGTATQYTDASLSVIRHRWIGDSFTETLTLINHDSKPRAVTVRMRCESDFADIFEIKDEQRKSGQFATDYGPDHLRYCYTRGDFRRETIFRSTLQPKFSDNGMIWKINIEPDGEWVTEVSVEALAVGAHGRDIRAGVIHRDRKSMVNELALWTASSPYIESSSQTVIEAYKRSIIDLSALRFSLFGAGENMPAAGLPWFMTAFGRDSIFTSFQALPFAASLAQATLRTLSALQGTRVDDFRDEEPGKIPHEIRFGESAAFYEQPHSPYYGTADATSLFVILLDEYERWTGDHQMVIDLEFETRAALNWIGTYGDQLGTGYVWYKSRNPENGLVNQCWKDSWDAISYDDGSLPEYPLATCELQGYAYDAKIRGARLARAFWNDQSYASQLESEAAELRERFNRDFWVADDGYFALGIDRDGRQLKVLSSNIGHLLWSGIVDEAKAGAVADHLLGPRLFSGWGVRTLAVGEKRYNPLGYHVGTVWPFDNSIIAWGLRRYGFTEKAARICKSILDASAYFNGRLPEAFAGYPRALTGHPVEYPTACSPQAWSSGTPLLLLRTLLGLDSIEDHLVTSPALPSGIDSLSLVRIQGRWGEADAIARRSSRRTWRPGNR
ncbi:glycogen debranching N-terminal domain-containing protein [Micromonospora sp. NPDC005324]|uniref:amylo-alpha-1,6-glucosidase n=1 Tax=Micromonospora sp. NPDC005324 TaxID=3157033 RepID=UPI0033BE8BA6